MNFKESKAIYLQIADRICDEVAPLPDIAREALRHKCDLLFEDRWLYFL